MCFCFCVSQSNTKGTVKDKANFKAEEDVSALRKAIEGIGKLRVIDISIIRQTCKAVSSHFTNSVSQ